MFKTPINYDSYFNLLNFKAIFSFHLFHHGCFLVLFIIIIKHFQVLLNSFPYHLIFIFNIFLSYYFYNNFNLPYHSTLFSLLSHFIVDQSIFRY